MVNSDTGLQDPDKPEDQLQSSEANGVILVSDDELEDDAVGGSHDYQLLSTDDFAESESHGNSDNENTEAGNSFPSITPIEDVLVQEVWSGTAPKEVDIEMDSKKIDEVKQAMTNVTLPPTVFPEWASSVPEDSWKQIILNRINKE